MSKTLGAALAAAVCCLSFAVPAFAVNGPSPGAVTAQTVTLPSGPGSVRGLADDASVSGFTGQVHYAVPIELPAGPGGLTPSLSVGYDGELGNGPLGVGWHMAQPHIQRSLRLGVPRYDASDEIELVGLGAGGQLVALPTGELRVEGQGNAITGRVVDGGYELTDADGRVYRFGTTTAARKANGTRVSAWYLEEIRDVAGHTLSYRYRADRGEIYLDAIEWGPTILGTRAFRAALTYEPRADAVVSYRTGFRVESALRVTGIRVDSFGGVRRLVSIGYDDSFPLTRVQSVRVTSGDGVDALPETRFTYAATEGGAQVAVAGIDGWVLNLQGTSLFDVDSDGAMDLMRLTSSGHSWRRNLGGVFAPAAPMPGAAGSVLDQVRLVDLDGDSVAEMLRQQGSQWIVYHLDRASASWISLGNLAGAASVSLSAVAIADVDGDRRMDVLSASGSHILLRRGTDGGLASPVTLPAIDAARSFVQPGSASTFFYDVNGDGLADAIQQSASMFYLYLGRGDGTFEKYRDVAYPWTGSVSPSQVRLGDLNRDGLLDVAVVRAGFVSWYRGRANGTFDTTGVDVARPPGTDASVVVALADANGNGSQDLVWSSPAGMWILDLAGPTTAGMLVAVDNGLGKTQRFGYAASTTAMFADDAAGAPWTRTMPVSIPVAVTRRLELASGEPSRSARLDVRDGIYDPGERRFIGFERSTLTRPAPEDGAAPADTIRTFTQYAPGLGADRVLRGQVLSERVEDGTGKVFTETTHQVAAVAIAGLPATDPRLRRAVVLATEVHHHEGQASPLVTRQEVDVDDEGRVIETRDLGRLDLTGDESTVRTQYTAGRSARGVRDRVCETWTLTPDGDVVSHARTLYGDDQAIAPLCDAGAGWVRESESYLAEEARWITTSTKAYSADGFPTETTEGGVTRHLEVDPYGLHAVAETVQPTAVRTLRWAVTWDDVLGVPRRLVDADGTAVVIGYDGLGRVRSLARDGAAPHVVYTYHDVAPRPFVETFTYDGPSDDVTPLPATWTAGARWRHSVNVMNSAAEPLFTMTRLGDATWLVDGRRERDALGRTVAVANAYEASGTLADLIASALPAATPTQRIAYDALDRPVRQTLPDGAATTRAYRAFQTTVTTDGLAPVTLSLDGGGRIVRTARTIDGTVEEVEASYDTAGRIVALRLPTSAGGVEHHYTYDSLGRLVAATDPDIGSRAITYDDAGRIVVQTNGAGQSTSYAYDGAGRLVTQTADDGSQFVYHYDDARDPARFPRTAGRVAWVEEPTGIVEQGYNLDGRVASARRTIDGRVAEQHTTWSASGLLLASDDGDGFSFDVGYDPAGRLLRVGDLWQVDAQDAAGRALREHFGNGVVEQYERDVLGQATRIRVERAGGTAVFDATVGYDPVGSIESVTDHDGVGLDHSAAFAYDGGARLLAATIGAGPAAFQFDYAYDGLQNMVRRDVQGPTSLGVLAGAYRYGEPRADGTPRGPRQLTSVVPDSGAPATTFDYDPAGRMVRQGGVSLAYNGFDQLLRVDGPAGTVTYAYGHDGLRVSTTAPDGSKTLRFSPMLSEEADGTRQLDISVGDHLIARVTRTPAPAPAGGSGVAGLLAIGALLLGLAALLVRAPSLLRARRFRPAYLAAAALLPGILITTSCGTPSALRSSSDAVERTTSRIVYYQRTIGAGPTLITREDGSVLEERRYEPFGVSIDAYREPAGGGAGTIGGVDFVVDPHNALNKQTDATTGWSDHGARWLAPETARWLTPDPPVKAPDPKFLADPWALHPYQYVNQNPVRYWDPDGREGSLIHSGGASVDVSYGGALYKHDLASDGSITLQLGRGELKTTNFNLQAEFTVVKVSGAWHPGDQDFVELGGDVSLGKATGRIGKSGARVELILAEAKGGVAAGPFSVGASIGFGTGYGAEWDDHKIRGEFKFIVGVSFEIDTRKLIEAAPHAIDWMETSFADAMQPQSRGPNVVHEFMKARDEARDAYIQGQADRAAHQGPFASPAPEACSPRETAADVWHQRP